MGENICKWSNWQRINLQNMQAAHMTQYQKTNNQQLGGRVKQTFLQRHVVGQQIHEKMLNITLEKCKSKLQWGTTSHRSEWPSSKHQHIINAGEEKRIFLHCWWECKLDKTTMANSTGFLKTLKIRLPYDPAILLLHIYPKETITQKDTSTPMFTEALLKIARMWKRPKCPLMAKVDGIDGRSREWTVDTEGERGGGMNWESSTDIYTLPCVK